jgi:hypothetical protein
MSFGSSGSRRLLGWAIIFSATAAYACYRCTAAHTRIDGWCSAKHGVTRVDFSQATEVEIVLPPAPDVHDHGYMIYLDPAREVLPAPIPDGDIRIDDGRGEPFVISLADATRDQRHDDGYHLCWTLRSPDSTQRVTIRTFGGFPAWDGVAAVVFARHRVCELEFMPVLLWALLAVTSALAAAMLWRAFFRRTRVIPKAMHAEPRAGSDGG